MLVKSLSYFKRNGLSATLDRAKVKLTKQDTQNAYFYWRKKYEIKPEEIEAQRGEHFSYEPQFSIVIPLFNTRPKFLKEMVDSIRNQTYSNWELCLADGTGEKSPLIPILKDYMAKDSRIRYEILTENKGISENTNAAIRMAGGDFIVLADHDDIMPANALYECAKALKINGADSVKIV